MSTIRVLDDFAGVWHIARTITPAQGPQAHFDGQATWEPARDGLQYVETGKMQIEGHAPLHAERRYFWARDLSVYFDDGRFFHKVPAIGGQTGHWCDPDQYDGVYEFAGWPRFKVTWQVLGPRKNYKSQTNYMRL